MTKRLKSKGHELTYMLRHKPEEYGVEIDKAGYVFINEVVKELNLTIPELEEIVYNDDKDRFDLDLMSGLIRANQGHSIEVDLGYEASVPPKVLYHGTVEKYIPWITKEGLKKMSRHHVHLSSDIVTAHEVASRRLTDNVLLEIQAQDMNNDGFQFFLSKNGVWLTETVPPKFIKII